MKYTAPFLLAFLFSCPALAECVDGDCTNGQGSMKYEDGSQYIGQWKDGKAPWLWNIEARKRW